MNAGQVCPCTIVLVRPKIAANLGAVARVMRNMGLCRLALVQPEADVTDPRARLLATHSEDILEQAIIVEDLGAAVAECGLVAATSARSGGLFRQQSAGTVEEVMPVLAEGVRQTSVALVFGPEDHGLTNEEIARCHYLMRIPTAPAHAALNLAQAVAICLYEWHRAISRGDAIDVMNEGVATFAEQERMFNQLRDALERIHFLYGDKADSLMHVLRHLIGRAGPTTMEVKVLLGLARQIRWFQEHHPARTSEVFGDFGSPGGTQAENS